MRQKDYRKDGFQMLCILTQGAGISYYRNIAPNQKMGINIKYWPDFSIHKLLRSVHNWEQAFMVDKGLLYDLEKLWATSNLIVCQRVSSRIGAAVLMGLKEKHPRPLYTEIDDNVFAVDSSNPGFHHVNPGSVAESMFLHQLQTSDGIITSTDELAKAYKKINKNIYIYKNSIDFDIWDKCNSINRDGSRINIVWQGAAHHFDDLKILSDVIPKILKKHGNVHFYFAGMLPDFLRQERTHYFDPVQIIKYPKFISSLKPDIMLAPLFDTEFNRGKSNLRVLEAGAMKKAVVASGNKNLPYAKTIVDGESGLLANTTEEWVEKIDRLILDKNLRVELGNNLYRHIKENYNIKNTAREYEQFLLTRGKKNGKLQGNVPEGAKVHK